MENTNVVYFIHTQHHVKIGISKNIQSRIKQVQTGCPTEIRKVEYIVAENREQSLTIEKLLHNEFNDLHTFKK